MKYLDAIIQRMKLRSFNHPLQLGGCKTAAQGDEDDDEGGNDIDVVDDNSELDCSGW